MAELIYSAGALADLERVSDFLRASHPVQADETAALIVEALALLRRHPLVGRRRGRLRELVVSRGSSGYVAAYTFDPTRDVVKVLRIRHQREVGSD